MTPAFRTHVSQNKGKLRRAAFFSTFSGSGSEKMLDELGKMCGLEPIALLGLNRKKAEERGHVAHVEKLVEEIRADLSRVKTLTRTSLLLRPFFRSSLLLWFQT